MIGLDAVRRCLRDLCQVVRLLTILPAPGAGRDGRPASASVAYLPVVGALLGLILAGGDALLAAISGGAAPGVRSALLLLLWAGLSGGMHLDGLVDTLDGISCPGDREAAIRALHDSRAGAKGAALCFLVLLTKWAAVTTLEAGSRPVAAPAALPVLAAAVLGRCAVSFLVMACGASRPCAVLPGSVMLRWLVGPGDRGVAVSGSAVGVVATFLVGATLCLARWLGSAATAAAATTAGLVTAALLARAALARFGGINGDVAGAACELTETAVVAAAALGQGWVAR